MRVILTKDVPGLGVLGDELQVKPGYARNYLIPQNKALLANSQQSKALQHHRRYLEKLRQEAIVGAQEKANVLKEQTFEIKKKSGANGRLFGSVTTRDLEALFSESGQEINRRDISIPTPIKAVGNHPIVVKLHTEVKVDVTLKVIGDIEAPKVEAAPVVAEEVEESQEGSEDAIEATEESADA